MPGIHVKFRAYLAVLQIIIIRYLNRIDADVDPNNECNAYSYLSIL